MVIIFLLVFSFTYVNAAEVGKMFKGPFISAAPLGEDILRHEHTWYTLACGDNNSKALLFHVILIKGVQGRTAIRDSTQLWKNGIVPYIISSQFGVQQKYKIHVAIGEFYSKTCARFVPHTNESQFLLIGPGKGCSSHIGKNPFGTISETRLRQECFLKLGTILHELMHILGFVHEHNRPDRDKYVKIIEENVMEGFLSQFEKYTWDEVQNFSYSYDYGSVMHYGANFFSKDRTKLTIVPLKMDIEIGQRRGFSNTDILKINRLYNCSESEYSSVWFEEDPDTDLYT